MAVLTPSGSDQPTRLVSVPFTLPGELVKIHVHRHEPEYYMSHGDLLEIIERSEKRDASTPPEVLPSYTAMSDEAKEELRKVREKFGNRVQCRYFGTCSGCQVSSLGYLNLLHNSQLIEANLTSVSTPRLRRTTRTQAKRRSKSFRKLLETGPIPRPRNRSYPFISPRIRLPNETNASLPSTTFFEQSTKQEESKKGKDEED